MSQKLDTSCKDCLFAEYDKITQIGCEYHRLDIFREHNVNIAECYDEDKEFYVIVNNKCPYKRTEKWEQYAKWKDTEPQRSKTDHWPENRIRRESEMKYQVIIYDDYTTYELAKTLTSLVKQDIRTIHISVIRYREDNSLSQIRKTIENHLGKPSKTFNWKIIDINNPDTDYPRYIDIALKSTHHPFYVVTHSGYEFEENIFVKINNKIIDECFKFSMLDLGGLDTANIKHDSDPSDAYIIPYSIHDVFNGNYVYTLRKKIKNRWKTEQNGIYHISKI